MTAVMERSPIALTPTFPKVWPADRFARFDRQDDKPRLGNVEHLQIELTNHCDLQCVECPQRLMNRRREWMGMGVLEAIFEKLLQPFQFETIIPHKDGESLLYPHILPAIRTMSQVHKGKFVIYTNGTHFTKEFYDVIRTLDNKFQVFMSFHQIGFSGREKFKQGCTETREYSTDEAGAALMACLAEPSENVEFAISSHLTPFVDHAKMEGWKRHWDGVAEQYPTLTGVHLNTAINPWGGHMKDMATVEFQECPYGDAAHMFVGVTGSVLPCCIDLNEDLVIADLMRDSIDEIVVSREDFYRRVAIPSLRKPRCVECLGGCGTTGGCS